MQDTEKLEKAVTLHRVNKEVSSKGKFEQRLRKWSFTLWGYLLICRWS